MSYSVSEASLNWALSHIEREGDSDFFPHSFEFKAIRHDWAEFRTWLHSIDLHHYAPCQFRSVIAPKGYYGFRYVTQLSPQDSLLYTAMMHEAGNALEGLRRPKAEGVVHSYRFMPQPDGAVWDPNFHYGSFHRRTREVIETDHPAYVAETDIADFYHRIYSHRFEGAVQRALPTGHGLFPALKSFRNALFRRESNRGLPIGPAASALFAEAVIADVDDFLRMRGLRYVRFNDDFRFFCGSEGKARQALRDLAGYLWDGHGLTLQARKTTIMPADRYMEWRFPEPRDDLTRLAAITEQLFSGNPYATRSYSALDAEEQALVDQLDLEGLISQSLEDQHTVDVNLLRMALARMTALCRADSADLLIQELPRLFPVIPNVVRFLRVFSALGAEERSNVGGRVLNYLSSTAESLSEFEAMWLLSLFGDGTWNNVEQLAQLKYRLHASKLAQRKIAAAFAHMNCNRAHLLDYKGVQADEWLNRSAILASRALHPDERGPYWSFLKSQLSRPLDLAVLKWVKSTV